MSLAQSLAVQLPVLLLGRFIYLGQAVSTSSAPIPRIPKGGNLYDDRKIHKYRPDFVESAPHPAGAQFAVSSFGGLSAGIILICLKIDLYLSTASA